MSLADTMPATEPVTMTCLGASDEPLPLVIRPKDERAPQALTDWIQQNHARVSNKLTSHGALLFRGFNIQEAAQFEQIALAIRPDLKSEYMGTSPRTGITRHVFTASELPGYYPIPQHCEMSFLRNPPSYLFFYCKQPARVGGETPLVDFRRVHQQLDPDVLQRFVDGGIRIYRNYNGPNHRSGLDLWKLKRWDEMFGTVDPSVVERKCHEYGLRWEWLENERLRIVDQQEAVQAHPQTGIPAWFSHLQVFHLASAPAEYKRIYKNRGGFRMWSLWQITRLIVAVRRRLVASEDLPLHATYKDGTEIPDADIEHLRDVIWQNMVVYPWEAGDVLAIDNRSVSHGRLPYRDQGRQVLVSWA